MKIGICQSTIPAYRIPIFEHFGSVPGVELTVYTTKLKIDAAADHTPEHYKVVSVPEFTVPLSFGKLFYRPDFTTAITSGDHDLVILPWNARFVNLGNAVQTGRRLGVPVVLWGHGYSKHPRFYADWQRNRIGRQAAGVLLYSQTVADSLVKNAGFAADRVFVAQNAIDQTAINEARWQWQGNPEKLANFRRENNVSPENTIVFVSRLLKENGTDMLVEGMKRLRTLRPDARAVIVGKGPEEARMRSMVSSNGLENHVTFTGAIYDEMTLAPWMLSAGAFAYPTNIGLSLIHAMGYGLPTVTTDAISQQNPEIEALVDGVNGCLYKHGDIDDMVSQWNMLLGNRVIRERMGRAAMATVREKYNARNMVDGFLSTTSLISGDKKVSIPSTFLMPEHKEEFVRNSRAAAMQKATYAPALASTGS